MADDTVYEIVGNYPGTQTSMGVKTIIEGSLIEGSPSNYITLEEDKVMQTTVGSHGFRSGAKINCDHEPGEPDPCNQS